MKVMEEHAYQRDPAVSFDTAKTPWLGVRTKIWPRQCAWMDLDDNAPVSVCLANELAKCGYNCKIISGGLVRPEGSTGFFI